MPRRFERHRRGTQYWDAQPARSDEVREAAAVDPEPAKRSPGRKNTRDWCKGKPGVPHAPSLVLAPPVLTNWVCRWWPGILSARDGTYPVEWRCHHRELCQRCGKVIREPWELEPGECPAYPGSGEQRAEAEVEAECMTERHQTWWARARPVITGRQGYRRRKTP